MRRFHGSLLGLATGVTLISAACGGGGGDSATPASPGVRTPGGAVAVAPKCPASARLGDTVKHHGSVTATGTTLALEAGDAFFAPTCVTGIASGKVSVTVKNTGGALHNFSIPEQSIDLDVAPGKSITVELNVPQGTTPFNCKYHRASGMVGALLTG